MMKQFSLFFLFFCSGLAAQVPQPALPRDYAHRQTIDTVNYQVVYSCRIRRVLHTESYSSDMQVLEIGNRYTRYYSRDAELSDSLFKYAKPFYGLGSNASGVREPDYEDIYFDYPKKGTVSVYNRYMKKNFLYMEDRVKPVWRLIPSESVEILGYTCFKAETKFRGRTWYAWFAPDIPLNAGPWKLSGLPGLILKAEDADAYFTYEAVGMVQDKGTQMMMYDEKSQKCRREDILVLNDLRWKDDAFLLKTMNGTEVISFDPESLSFKTKEADAVVIPQKEIE